VHFKFEQLQVLLAESHATIGTIQQKQDAASVLRVSTQQLACGLTNRHFEMQGNSLEDSDVITTNVE